MPEGREHYRVCTVPKDEFTVKAVGFLNHRTRGLVLDISFGGMAVFLATAEVVGRLVG